MISLVLVYLALGAVVGIMAGLLGIGGGLLIVPMLVYLLPSQGAAPEQVMHLALGTSLGSIVFTAVSSALAHHRRGAVHWGLVVRIAAGIVAGTFTGACFASTLPTKVLKVIFVVFLYYVGWQMLSGRKPKATRTLPGPVGTTAVGVLIGALSSLVGIGGGTMSVTFLVWCNMSIHQAIGTSAAIGFPIAVAGAAGYLWRGLAVRGLPEYALGYLYLPALLGIGCASIMTAPLGARLAHRLPVTQLKKIFAALLLIVATKMLFDVC